MRPPPSARLVALLVPLLALPFVGSAAPTPHGDVAIEVTLDEETRSGAVTMLVRTSRIAEADDEGVFVRLPVPIPLTVTRFGPEGHEPEGTWRVVNNSTSFGDAVFRWQENAPEAGTEIDDVVLEASRPVGTSDTITIIWFRYEIDALDLVVDVPASHEVAGSHLTRQVHGVEPGRRIWADHDFNDEAVSLIIRPENNHADPAHSDPPWSGTGFVIVIMIGLVSGGAWYLGKRLELRRKGPGDGPL